MTRLTWTTPGSGAAGLEQGVFYSKTSTPVPWNGLISIESTDEGSEERVQYLDGTVFQKRRWAGDYSGQIKAYTYPDTFYTDVLLPIRNVYFGMSWRVPVSSGYQIHLAYNVLLLPTQQEHVPDGPSPFQWDFTTSPVVLPDARRAAHLIIDANIAEIDAIAEFEDILYGSTVQDARLPMPDEIFAIFEARATLIVTYYEDGTADIQAPDGVLDQLDTTTWQIDWPSVVKLDSVTYEVSSF
jgi:hypothetical protein